MLDEAGLEQHSVEFSIARAACRDGRLGSLQLLHERGGLVRWRDPTSHPWLNSHLWSPSSLLGECAKTGHEAAAECLVVGVYTDVKQAGPDTPYSFDGLRKEVELFSTAAALCSVPLLQQLRQRGIVWKRDGWDSDAWKEAVHSSCEALVQWLHDEGCPWQVCGVATKLHSACGVQTYRRQQVP
jgi:hypothetical protein